ncbi:MAG TPA: 2-succinyl-5-enolpyruvyl-6-hydroxy-3-cyclohexene-1-carboxylic-acid synthase [Acidimicrobiales bacterium]|nr:2-succinyl-5-enolpyruvyl-6-hydroxy-3-cyclohexene-1-carboxylic-acid synthase [Acidimicrobiales bacterium]
MTSFAANDVQAAFARVMVDEWVRAGVADAVACPGSRSTPLLVALAEAAERGALRLHVLLDERSAGFFTLGLSLASPSGLPAVVVTTSGTAAAELLPSVLEAHHSGVPMLAVTADRPPELQDSGAPQTVHQVGLYGDAVRWEASPGVAEMGAAPSWRSLASRSVLEACGGARRPGPVHLNLAFREPLLGSADRVLGPVDLGLGSGPEVDAAAEDAGRAALSLVRDGRPGRAPWHQLRARQDEVPPSDIVQMLAEVGERGLVVAGGGGGSGAGAIGADAVAELSAATGWPVMASPLSGCRLPGAIGAADALLRSPVVQGWQPDVVVRLGAPWASRVVNEWLAALSCTQVLVDPWGIWAAPDHAPGEVAVTSPAALCQAVAKAVREKAGGHRGSSSGWARGWSLAESAAQEAIGAALAREADLTEPGIARALVGAVPAGGTVVVSSSMPIRDVEWWGRPRGGLAVVANRGVNGIDGVLSTALGFATSGNAGPVTALLGDLAFLYDAAALLAAACAGVDLDVVVVDNDGGGIFNFLPQSGAQPPARFERLWGTPHGADLVAIARGYGVAVEEVPDLASLASAVAEGGQGKGFRVFVARTDRAGNVAVHRRLHMAVEAAVVGLAGPI